MSGTASITKPCTPTTVESYNVGDDIEGVAKFTLSVPAATTYRYTWDFRSIDRSRNCHTVTRVTGSGEIPGPASADLGSQSWTHNDAIQGIYEVRAELSAEKKLNGTWGPVEVLASDSCIYKVGNADLGEPRASISDLSPCGTTVKVGQQVTIKAKFKFQVLGNDSSNKYDFEYSVKSLQVSTGQQDAIASALDRLSGGDPEAVKTLSTLWTPGAQHIGTHRLVAEIRALRPGQSTGNSSSSGSANPCAKYEVLAVNQCTYEVVQESSSSSMSSSSAAPPSSSSVNLSSSSSQPGGSSASSG